MGNGDRMVLLYGADGMSGRFARALTMGGTGLGLARQLFATMDTADRPDIGAKGDSVDKTTAEEGSGGGSGGGPSVRTAVTAPRGGAPRAGRVPVRGDGGLPGRAAR
ncbi:hypothetical protein GCM10018779_25980 [Streptomyces griseocarneus]|nr:hypothetical protein GCM10018779_25980 [Streptomyces griseocarneus]